MLTPEQRSEVLTSIGISITHIRNQLLSAPDQKLERKHDLLVGARSVLEQGGE